jgi:FlaA1/EpsC-like NDP-sugar epimerase
MYQRRLGCKSVPLKDFDQISRKPHLLNLLRISIRLTVAMEEKNPFGHAFGERDVFLTGATGMLGTALLVKITKDTTLSQVHVLVRGGEGRYLHDDTAREYCCADAYC